MARDNSIHKGTKINFFGHLNETVMAITNKLTLTQQALFRRTCFGKFLEFDKIDLSVKLIYNIIMCMVDRDDHTGDK